MWYYRTLELLNKLGHTPRRQDLAGGEEGVEYQFESDLIVALAGAAVGQNSAVLLLGDSDLLAGDDGSGERGSEQVAVFVDGVALDGGVNNLLDKLQMG